MREKLDAWLRGGGTIRIVPVGAFVVAGMIGVVPMWLEFGAFPAWAPRDVVRGPLLAGWIAVFLATEVVRRVRERGAARCGEARRRSAELQRAEELAGVIDRLCAPYLPRADGAVTPDRIHAALLQGIVDATRAFTGVAAEVRLHAVLLLPVFRREGRRQVGYLRAAGSNRLAEGRGWARFTMDGRGPAQDTYRDGEARAVPDTAAEGVRGIFRDDAYRSILTLPVELRCREGRRLAIVSVDAPVPGLFTDALLRDGLEQAVSPYVKLIALTLVRGRS